VLPYANRRAAELRDEIKKRPVETYNVLDRRWMMGQENQIYNYAFYDPARRRFNGLAVYRYSAEPFGLAERLYAREADWVASEGAWTFKNGWRRNFREGGKSRGSTSERSWAWSLRPISSRKRGARSR
jgi:lipopolysaccharide export LptBFGC system permease protein LptF